MTHRAPWPGQKDPHARTYFPQILDEHGRCITER